MSFGTAQRGTLRVLGDANEEFVARWRVVAPMIYAKATDGRIYGCYRGDKLDWLEPKKEAHFLRLGLVEKIDADAREDSAGGQNFPPAVRRRKSLSATAADDDEDFPVVVT